jgi:hypothetical protein
MNRPMSDTKSSADVKVTRFGLLLALAVIAYIAAVVVFIIVR